VVTIADLEEVVCKAVPLLHSSAPRFRSQFHTSVFQIVFQQRRSGGYKKKVHVTLLDAEEKKKGERICNVVLIHDAPILNVKEPVPGCTDSECRDQAAFF